jgi:hypothetical protein
MSRSTSGGDKGMVTRQGSFDSTDHAPRSPHAQTPVAASLGLRHCVTDDVQAVIHLISIRGSLHTHQDRRSYEHLRSVPVVASSSWSVAADATPLHLMMARARMG